MREIKFRIWNKLEKKFVEPIFNAFFNKLGEVNKNKYNELNQYTGLKDKNNVEIYEGDIIKVNGNLYEVWHSGLAFGLIDKNKDFFEYMCQLCDMNGKVYEVIGNIYENPELLKDTEC